MFLISDFAHWISSTAAAIRYPFELEYAEGPILGQIQLLQAGKSAYESIFDESMTVTTYPLVFHYAVTIVSWFGLEDLAAGRIVSSVSTIAIVLVIGILTFRATRESGGPYVRGAGAVLAGLLFLNCDIVLRWGPLLRIDMLASFLSIAGLAVFILSNNENRKVLLSAPFFVLAMYTKQSAIAGLAACLLMAGIANPKLALKLTVVVGFIAAMVLAVAVYFTDGQFFVHIFLHNMNHFELSRMEKYVLDYIWGVDDFTGQGVFLIVAVVGSGYHLARFLKVFANTRKNSVREFLTTSRAANAVLSFYVITVFLVALTVGKIGSSYNYFIEVVAASSIIFAVVSVMLVSETLRRFSTHMADAFVPVSCLAILLLAANILSLQSFLLPVGGYEKAELHAGRVATVLEEVKEVSGNVLSEDMTLLALSGKPILFQPFIATQLSNQGTLELEPIHDAIEDKAFPLIILLQRADKNRTYGRYRFHRSMMTAVTSNYILTKRVRHGRTGPGQYYYLYRPQP